ncbi:MAG: DNA polymerase III subunit delta [Sulfurospirillum sp.]|nr:DNA polymerase III subunit delta [Sulfurospirillum sp.]
MYKRDLERALQTKTLPQIIFLYGECDYQNNYFAQKTLAYWGVTEDEKLSLYFDEYDTKSAIMHLSQSSLFGGKNVLLIKTDKDLSKDAKELIQLCHKNSDNFFLYQYFGESQKAKKIADNFSKKNKADFVRFFKPNISEAMALLHVRAKEVGLEIQGYALSYLYMQHHENLSLCANEFEKLSLLDKEIDTNDIDRFVYGLGSVSMEDFIAKLLKKEDIRTDFATLCESGVNDENDIIRALEFSIVSLLQFHMYIKIHGTFDAREILGYPLPPQIAAQRAQACMKIDLITYKNLLEYLFVNDLKLKKVKNLDKNSFLLATLIGLQKLL